MPCSALTGSGEAALTADGETEPSAAIRVKERTFRQELRMLFSRDNRFCWQLTPSIKGGGIEVRKGTTHQAADNSPAIGRAEACSEIEALAGV